MGNPYLCNHFSGWELKWDSPVKDFAYQIYWDIREPRASLTSSVISFPVHDELARQAVTSNCENEIYCNLPPPHVGSTSTSSHTKRNSISLCKVTVLHLNGISRWKRHDARRKMLLQWPGSSNVVPISILSLSVVHWMIALERISPKASPFTKRSCLRSHMTYPIHHNIQCNNCIRLRVDRPNNLRW